MSDTQREALRWMDEQNATVVLTVLGWTWRQHVRDGKGAALAVLDARDTRGQVAWTDEDARRLRARRTA